MIGESDEFYRETTIDALILYDRLLIKIKFISGLDAFMASSNRWSKTSAHKMLD